MLATMLTTQRKLNDFAGINPQDERMLERVVYALTAELGEAFQETKATWSWWKPDAVVDVEKLQEEVVDCFFFLLTVVDVLERQGHIINADEFMLKLSSDIGQQMDAAYEQMVGDQDRLAVITQYTPRHIQMLLALLATPELNINIIASAFGGLYAVARTVGFEDWMDILDAYRAKAVVNIQRWEAAAVIPEKLQPDASELRTSLAA